MSAERLAAASGALVPVAIVLATVAVALASYALSRRLAVGLLGEEVADEATANLAASITFRVAALHALILGLVFAHETGTYRQVAADLVREATAVTDVFYDLDRYGGEQAAAVRTIVADYAAAVVEDDWPSLRQRAELAAGSYQLWEAAYEAVLDLAETTPREAELRRHMLSGVHLIAELRQARVNAARTGIPPLFWLAAVAGVIFISLPYFVFRPSAINLTLLALFAVYTGLVLAVIYALADPFSPPGAFRPTAFADMLAGELGGFRSGAQEGSAQLP